MVKTYLILETHKVTYIVHLHT